MHIAIDQSPRIENWTKDSVIAFSNTKQRALILTSQLKREALAVLKERDKTEDTAKWMILAAGIFLLVQSDLAQMDAIVIDREFDDCTMARLLHWLWIKIKKQRPAFGLAQLSYRSLRRKNPAHYLAYGLFTGLIKPDREIRVKRRDLLALFGK
jgi:hypothetical protein